MAITIKNVTQGTQEWLDLRKNLVTCSNALLLIEKGKTTCIKENKRAAEQYSPNGNAYAERGHVLEREVREMLNDQLINDGFVIHEAGMIFNSDYPDAAYSPDGLMGYTDSPIEDYFGIIEIKCYNDIVERKKSQCNHLKEGERIVTEYFADDGEPMCSVYVGKHAYACKKYENVPLAARMQIQMELLISEAEFCYLVLYNPDATGDTPKLEIHRVEPDPEVQEVLRENLK